MKVKCLCLILAVILLFSFPITAPASEETIENQTKNAIEFLADLNVFENVYEADKKITRGDFVDLVVSAMKCEVQAEIDGSFVDVDKNHKSASNIYNAKLLGVVSGAQGNRFYPDSEISYDAAVKMLVSALGYKNQAEAFGGYPIGYSVVAKNISLTKGVPVKDESALSFGEAGALIYNFLTSDLCEIVKISGEDSTSKRQYGVNLLNTKYGLKTIEGVVKSAGFMSATPNFDTDESVIEIDGEVYKAELKNAEKYIGLSVKAYVNAETKKVEAVYPDTANEIVEIKAEDVVSYNNFNLEVSSDNSVRNDIYKFDRGFYYIKNGRSSKNVEFLFEDGTITLIDNNGDRVIDFAIAQKYDYMLVSSISTLEDGVYDIDADKKVYFQEDFGYHYDLVIDGENKKYDYLKEGMVLTIIKSDDEKYVKAIASSKSVAGAVTELGNDVLKIGEIEYKPNNYFKENYIVSPGTEGEFLISHDGKIAALKTNTKGKMRYAYLYGYHKSVTGLSSQVQIKILDQGGQHMIYSLADKLIFNGSTCNKTDSIVSDTFANGEYPKYQVIRYSVDDNSLIKVIDTAEEMSPDADAEDKYTIDFSGNNTLTRFVKNKNTYYDNSQSFLPFAAVNSETIIFSVPNSIADSVNEGKEPDGRNAFYDKKFFSIFRLSSLDGRKTLLCDVYDQSKYMQPGVMVLYNNVSGTSASVGEGATPKIVDRVVDAISPEGDYVKKMTVLSGTNYVSYYLDDDLCAQLGADGIPQSGDIIRMETNSVGEISALVVDARFNKRTGKIEIINQAKDQVYYPYYTGKMFSHGNGAMALLVEDKPFMDAYSAVPEDGVYSFVLPSSVTYMRYDVKQNAAVPIRAADIEDVLAVGRDNASTVILQSYSHSVRVLVEYVNE